MLSQAYSTWVTVGPTVGVSWRWRQLLLFTLELCSHNHCRCFQIHCSKDPWKKQGWDSREFSWASYNSPGILIFPNLETQTDPRSCQKQPKEIKRLELNLFVEELRPRLKKNKPRQRTLERSTLRKGWCSLPSPPTCCLPRAGALPVSSESALTHLSETLRGGLVCGDAHLKQSDEEPQLEKLRDAVMAKIISFGNGE